MNNLIISSSSSSTMASRGLLFLKATATNQNFGDNNNKSTFGRFLTTFRIRKVQKYSTQLSAGLQPPDVSRLAETARISLTPNEVEEFGPKIQQVVDWFGKLQAVDLESVEPAIRADTEGDNLRVDIPEIFENREAMIAAVPSYEETYIKVPKVLNKE